MELREIFNEYEVFEDFVHDYSPLNLGHEIKINICDGVSFYGWVDAVCFDEKQSKFCFNVSTDCGKKFNYLDMNNIERI